MKGKIIGFILICCLVSKCLSIPFMAEEIVSSNGFENPEFYDNEMYTDKIGSSSECDDFETKEVQYSKIIDTDSV